MSTATDTAVGPLPQRRIRRRWAVRALFLATAAAAGLSIALITYASSVEPGAALVKAVFEASPEVTPPAHFASIAASVKESRRIQIAVAKAPAAGLNIYSPAQGSHERLPVVLWIHGGGFISSSADTVKDYVTLLASRGYVVANLDYTLAPGARHPVPVRQGNAALRYLDDHISQYDGDASRIFIGGDSAGAQIASELTSVETNPALATQLGIRPAVASAHLRGVILFCGLYDMHTVGSTHFPALRTYLWAYTGSRTWTDYADISTLSTTVTATARFPATFISVGDADPLHTQGSEFASALKKRGVPVTTLFWNGTDDQLGHEYQFDFALPQAGTAFRATLDFLSAHEGGS